MLLNTILCLLLLSLICVNSSPASVPSAEYDEEEASCTNRLINELVDSILARFAKLFDPLKLPNVIHNRLKMSSTNLTGLESLHRSCDFHIKLNPQTNNFEIAFCIGLDKGVLDTFLDAKLLINSFHSKTKVVIKDLKLNIKLIAPLRTGGPLFIEYIEIANIGAIKINHSGFIGVIDPMANALLNTGIKKMIMKIASKRIPKAINEILIQYPL